MHLGVSRDLAAALEERQVGSANFPTIVLHVRLFKCSVLLLHTCVHMLWTI